MPGIYRAALRKGVSVMELKKVLREQKEFFRSGATRDLRMRRSALLKLKAGVQKHEAEIIAALQADLGKSPFESYETEIGLVYREIHYMLRHLEALAAPEKTAVPLACFPASGRIYREPYGTVLIMSPWNYPFQLTMLPLIGALAAGNCAVVKPSAYSPAVSAVLRQIFDEVFPDYYVCVVLGGRKENQELLERKYDYIFFTGSRSVGKEVMKAASRRLTPLTLELGGKSPCIVDETADIPLAARRIVWGKFLNCGQTCVAPDYVLVHRRVKERLLKAMVRNIEALYGTSPLESKDYGRIINEKHFDRLTGLLCGHEPFYSSGSNRETCRLGPVILDDVSWSDKVMEDEIFGPILPVLEFDDLRRVREQLCTGSKPLALYLFTRSKAAERCILSGVSFGGGCINDTVMHLSADQLPFGGVGESGMGSYHGKYSFRTFSHEKSVMRRGLLIDVPLRYPPFGNKMKWMKLFLR